MINLSKVKKFDEELFSSMEKELERQQNNIELIASENFVSENVMQASGTFLTNKYAEGTPGHRYYGGCTFVDEIEQIAINRAKQLFNAEHANVQPHCGANANFAVYVALLKEGDTVLGMDLAHGGHLTHGSKVNVSGKYYNFVSYGVSEKTGRIDYANVKKTAKQCMPKLIVAGASSYSRLIDYKKFREIADEVGAYLMVDMAHIAGLVAAKLIPNPCEYADVVTTTTHKTLRGTRGGLILCKEELAKKIDKGVFPGTQGGPLEHIIAAKAITFKEAMQPEFVKYQKNVLKNAKAMVKAFKDNGVDIVSGGTDNHLLLLDLRKEGITGKEAEELLDKCNITVNKNAIPFDPTSPNVTSGIRIGTPAITSRGFKAEDCKIVAKLIVKILREKESAIDGVKEQVKLLTTKYPLYKNTFKF